MWKKVLPFFFLLSGCGGREKISLKLEGVPVNREPSGLLVVSDPADTLKKVLNFYMIDVTFSKPVDPSSLEGNIFLHRVLGDVEDGENRLDEGIPLKSYLLYPDGFTLSVNFSVPDGQYVLHLKKGIRSISGEELDGSCDLKDEPADAYSSGFLIGDAKEFATKPFCEFRPHVSYLGPVWGSMDFEDHAGCSGEANTDFSVQPEFLLNFSFPTNYDENHFLSEQVGENIELRDLTTDERIPLYFSLDNRVNWKDDIRKFETVPSITHQFPVYFKPPPLPSLHRFAIRINRFEGMKDRYGIPFWDRDPDEDDVLEVCFTTYGTSETLRVKDVQMESKDDYITLIKISFLTPDRNSDIMDSSTLIPENFSIMKGLEYVPFKLEVHREVFLTKETDIVFLMVPRGFLRKDEGFTLTISYRVADERGNTLDGNEDGIVEFTSNDNYIRNFP